MTLEEFAQLATQCAEQMSAFHNGQVSDVGGAIWYEPDGLHVTFDIGLFHGDSAVNPRVTISSAPAIIGNVENAAEFHKQMAFLCNMASEFNRVHGDESVEL